MRTAVWLHRRHEDAWQALEEANAVRRTFDPYMRVDEEDSVNQLLRTFQVGEAQATGAGTHTLCGTPLCAGTAGEG